jgi:uncharacterized membrane protein
MSDDNSNQFIHVPAFKVASLAILIAVTAIFTYIIRIPIAPTRGYINFGDVAIFFTAILFGPWTAFIAGGVGTALADLISGYAQWAPFTFFAHGLQGLFIGLVIKAGVGMRNLSRRKNSEIDEADVEGESDPESVRRLMPNILTLIIAFLVGTITMGGIYFITGGIMVGFPAAAAEIPGNILQNAVGVIGGTPLALAVWKAYPPIRHYNW